MRDGADPEDLHRFRVATRRSRALIRASRPLIRDQLAALDRELRWLGGASGPGPRPRRADRAPATSCSTSSSPTRPAPSRSSPRSSASGSRQRETLVRAIDTRALPGAARALRARRCRALGRLDDERRACAGSPSRSSTGSAPPTTSSAPTRPTTSSHAVRIKAKHARYAAELAARAEGAAARARSPRRCATSRT